MILGPGTHKFDCESPSFDWASVSSKELSKVTVFRGDEIEDCVYVLGPTHTWWSSNPLFTPPLRDGEKVTINIEGPAYMRIECVGLKRVEA